MPLHPDSFWELHIFRIPVLFWAGSTGEVESWLTQNDVVFSFPQQRAVLLFTQFKTVISYYILSWFSSVFVLDIFNEPAAFTFVVLFRHLFHNCFIQSMDCRMQCIWIIVIIPVHWDTTTLLPKVIFFIVTEVCFGLALSYWIQSRSFGNPNMP